MITVNTLGKFQIMNENGILNDNNIRSAMLTKLLTYMIIHREQTLTSERIASALWKDEMVDNPVNALKNLMYRLRGILKKNLGEENLIITKPGTYCWNTEIELVLDVEVFERLCKKAKEAESKQDIAVAIEYYERAISLYHGEFMPLITDVHWIITENTYYHSIFISAIKDLGELYVEAKMYDELEKICNDALDHDNVNEELYYYLILSQMKQNKLQQALELYEKGCKILYNELGVRNPVRLQEIYKELLKRKKGIQVEMMEHVQEDMREENPQGAFFCGYPVFKEIYRLEMRKSIRLEQEKYILLLTIKICTKSSEEVEAFQMKKYMERMEQVLNYSLRLSDVVAKYSEAQFVVLLSFCTYECSSLVANRIISNFYKDNPQYKDIKIKVNIEEIGMADAIVKLGN